MAVGEQAGDDLLQTDVDEHELDLAATLRGQAPEYDLAHWATSNLAVALQASGELGAPAEEPEYSLRRALLLSSARVFRLARAGMSVLAAGYEAEARVFDRALLETRARRMQVLDDETGALARRWLAGKLEGGLAEAVSKSLADNKPGEAKALYRVLSGDVHPDLPQFISNLVRATPAGGHTMSFSPHRTARTRRSLYVYACIAAEATAVIGARTGIELPHHADLERALVAGAERMGGDLQTINTQDLAKP
jgi:hypothetical protein